MGKALAHQEKRQAQDEPSEKRSRGNRYGFVFLGLWACRARGTLKRLAQLNLALVSNRLLGSLGADKNAVAWRRLASVNRLRDCAAR